MALIKFNYLYTTKTHAYARGAVAEVEDELAHYLVVEGIAQHAEPDDSEDEHSTPEVAAEIAALEKRLAQCDQVLARAKNPEVISKWSQARDEALASLTVLRATFAERTEGAPGA